MSYLAMSTQLGPWVAPVFVIVCMVLAMPLVPRSWFKEHVIVTIAAGSIGGMVGTALGLTWPSFYFLHEHAFAQSIKSPMIFAGTISLFVLTAGMLAFLIVYLFKDHLIVRKALPFPMSRLVHDIVYIDKEKSSQSMMTQGIIASTAWNIFLYAQRVWLHPYAMQLHMIPMLISIGFVAGEQSAIPLLIGMASRKLALYGLRNNFFLQYSDTEFIIRFCSGILIALFLARVGLLISERKQIRATSDFFVMLKRLYTNYYLRIFFIVAILGSLLFLHAWNISWVLLLYVFIFLLFLCYNAAYMVGVVGVIELGLFVWLIVLPLADIYTVASTSVVAVAVFCMICIGMVVDLMFSNKLAYLSNIAYSKIIKYQLLGFIVAVISSGLIMWWYTYSFKLGSLPLTAQSAQSFDLMIFTGQYKHRVVLSGMLFGFIIRKIVAEPFTVIGSMLMSTATTFWLVLAGAFSYFVKKDEKFYPFWFGVYASHALWIMILAFV
ncbi:MAG TPA: hypothetical protein VLG50_04405 [Candidatus Saccharimonadales bacterium]|nr:hypothetical protein [Candidatus Saccharimonadales bacterium]